MFKLVYDLSPAGEYDNLKDAIKAFVDKVKETLKIGGSWQLLETACWIEQPNHTPLYFYNARDYAIRQGWMTKSGGSLAELKLDPTNQQTNHPELKPCKVWLPSTKK
ncbi:MAG: dihydroneopterin aldolase [Blastochloris sp.]|nr:dihydroneopterin aldolase [Blastochloris sp.]